MISRLSMIALAWLALMLAPPALLAAGNEPEIVRQMLDAFEKQNGFRPTYDSIEETDGRIIVHGMTFTPPAEEGVTDVPQVTVKTTVFDNPRVDDGGLYHIGKMEMRGFSITGAKDKAVRVTIPLAEAEDVTFLPESAAKTPHEKIMAGSSLFSVLRIGEVVIEAKDIPRISWRDLKFTWEGSRRNGEGRFRGDFGKLVIPGEVLDKAAPGENKLKTLGYDSAVFTGGMDYTSKWGERDIIHMDFAMRFGMEKAGVNEIAISDIGLPMALLESLKTAKAKSGGDRKMAEAEILDAFSRSMKDITILGARISWIDQSLTNRLIDYMAKKKGVSREAYIANLTVYPQIMLMQIGLPSLAAQASDQLRTFLNDPKSLSISFKAKAPMSIATMMTLFSDPAGLAETLGLKVEANTLK